MHVLKFAFAKNQGCEQSSTQSSSSNVTDFAESRRNDRPLDRETLSSEIVISPARSVNSEWHVDFVIPNFHTFSSHVKEATDTGIITGIARREIIQVLRTYISVHTITPNSEQYNTVCRKLVTKYPKLKDTEGDSCYVSSYNYV